MTLEELKAFCADPGDIHYYLTAPWSRGEFTYATNGHIILRVARIAGVEEQPKAPDAAGLFAKVAAPSNWMPVPAATMPPGMECDECKGTGIFTDTYGGVEHKEDCEWCNKTGKVKRHIGVVLAGTFFDKGYLSMLQGWEISPGKQKPAWIRKGDVTGLLMPRNRI